jgi:hypothetical protein
MDHEQTTSGTNPLPIPLIPCSAGAMAAALRVYRRKGAIVRLADAGREGTSRPARSNSSGQEPPRWLE